MLSIPQDRVKNNGEIKIQTLFIMEIDSGRQDGCRRIRGWSPLQLALQLRPPVLIARLAKQGEHILLVGLHPRLIEGVHVQQIAGEAAGVLERSRSAAPRSAGVLPEVIHDQVGHAALRVGQQGALHGPVPDEVQGLARQEVQPVAVRLVRRDCQLSVGGTRGAPRSQTSGACPPGCTGPWSGGPR